MNKLLIATAFSLGAMAVMWMGWGFIGSDALALTVTLVIGAVYTIGFMELLQYRHATSTLSKSMFDLTNAGSGKVVEPKVGDLDAWLNKLDLSLRSAVRLRIEGERVGLPAPVLTPYLVGLLVMLGLLGTFFGMVETLRGAVLAMEGTTELQTMRAALAAPIKGLGLAFGTSVAGVAASAMLGLISTLSRRDRMLATRELDANTATIFREYSLVHSREKTFKALQNQSQALPEVAGKLHEMATQIEKMSENLGVKMIDNQNAFHESVKNIFTDLTASVDKSLKETLTDSGRLAGESIRPIIKEAMEDFSKETQQTHQLLTTTAQKQFENLSGQFSNTSEEVTLAWKDGLTAHQHSNEALIKSLGTSFQSFSQEFEKVSISTLSAIDKTTAAIIEKQESGNKEQLDSWTNSLEQVQQQATKQLSEASKVFTDELIDVAEVQQNVIKLVTQDFETMSTVMVSDWQKAGEQSLAQQQSISDSLDETVRIMTEAANSTTNQIVGEIAPLLAATEELVKARIESEATWIEGHGERIESLTTVLNDELSGLRNEEERRGEAAATRLAGLESTVTTHLASLGQALEEPMTRLIETASETPKAAAEVISQLRNEISNNIERDNGLLKERKILMEEMGTLSSSMESASSSQREAVEALVESTATMMKEMGTQLTEHLGIEVSKIGNVADSISGSSVEMSSLADSFTVAIKLFNESNGLLIENLNRIEEALDSSSSRSDEQLGYYVAQAREIIDLSVSSQKEVFDELRQLSQKEIDTIQDEEKLQIKIDETAQETVSESAVEGLAVENLQEDAFPNEAIVVNVEETKVDEVEDAKVEDVEDVEVEVEEVEVEIEEAEVEVEEIETDPTEAEEFEVQADTTEPQVEVE